MEEGGDAGKVFFYRFQSNPQNNSMDTIGMVQSQIGKLTGDSQKLSREEMMRTACFWPQKLHYFQKRLTMCLSEKLHTKHMSCAHMHIQIYHARTTEPTEQPFPFYFQHYIYYKTLLCVYLQRIIQRYSSTTTQYHYVLIGNKLQCLIKCLLGFHNGHSPISPLSSMCCSLKTLPLDMWPTLSHGEHSHVSRGSTVAKLH